MTQKTTEGDPTATEAYTFGMLSLNKFLPKFINLNEMNVKEAAFADDFFVAGSLNIALKITGPN